MTAQTQEELLAAHLEQQKIDVTILSLSLSLSFLYVFVGIIRLYMCKAAYCLVN